MREMLQYCLARLGTTRTERKVNDLMRALKRIAGGALLFALIACAAGAQAPATTQLRERNVPQDGQSAQQPPTTIAPKTHRFWDRENILLFSGVGVARGLDYASTLNIRRRGLNEVLLTNAIVDNHPLFAGIEAAGTGASIGVSYIFHRTGHHTLERWTSIVHFGVAVGGAARNYALKTPHPAPE